MTPHPTPCVVDTTLSPHARRRPVPLTAVTLSDGFWSPRLHLNRAAALPAQYRRLLETGRLDNLRRVTGSLDAPFTGYFFNDSDVFKWLEAAAWALAVQPDPALAQMTEEAVTVIEQAQQPDGYLNSYYALDRAGERWTNLRDMHELYCAGHLFQAAVAHQRATGSGRLMAVARRLADHICATFGKGESKRPGVCGHPEVEMALIELARATGERRYLEQAQYFLNARGRGLIGGREYHQDHAPLRELDRMAGHAVRAAYLNAGAADLCAETGDPALRAALERMWRAMTERQMYLTGGVGPRHAGEAFGADYELPNARAYAETCASIAVAMWAWRMLALDDDPRAARYADVLETELVNGILSGLSLDGLAYFYENPLADDGGHRRQPWFDCACCPPNLARLLASLPGYFYSVSAQGIWTHLYAESAADLTLPDGRAVRLVQGTRYPWEGQVEIQVNGEGEFSLWLRVPGWCEGGAALRVNSQPHAERLAPGRYVEIRRHWTPGDRVRLELPMPVRRVEAHPCALENAGRVALVRGPLVYCVEAADQPGVDLRDVVLPSASALETLAHPDLPGIVALRGQAVVAPPDTDWNGQLYRTARAQPVQPDGQPLTLTAIPYYAWANRRPGAMQVWLRAVS
jgi:DUF1680 family protein